MTPIQFLTVLLYKWHLITVLLNRYKRKDKSRDLFLFEYLFEMQSNFLFTLTSAYQRCYFKLIRKNLQTSNSYHQQEEDRNSSAFPHLHSNQTSIILFRVSWNRKGTKNISDQFYRPHCHFIGQQPYVVSRPLNIQPNHCTMCALCTISRALRCLTLILMPVQLKAQP